MKRKKIEKQLFSLGLAVTMAFQLPVWDITTPVTVQAAETTSNTETQVVYTEYKGTGAANGTGTAQSPYKFFKDALKAVPEGGTIIIGPSGAYINDDTSDSAPFIINKKVTIKSESNAALDTRSGGIVLGADVTFQDMKLGFENKYNNAIFANGHTLTLKNVQRVAECREVHLFAGGLAGSGATSGNHGKIVIHGSAAQFGNIYGGSMNEPSTLPATITVNGESGMTIGDVYACGASTGYFDPNSLFDLTEPEAPAEDSARFPVTGKVTVELYNSPVKKVDGLASENNRADVVYSTVNLTEPELPNVGTLIVKSGRVAPITLSEGVNLVVSPETEDTEKGILDLTTIMENNDMTFTVGDFAGGGTLAFGSEDVLTITGEITGSTLFEISNGFGGVDAAEENHGYIDVRGATGDGEFTFVPYFTQEDMTFTKENGIWTTSGLGDTVPKVNVVTFDVKDSNLEFAPEDLGFSAEIGITGSFPGDYYAYPCEVNFGYELTYGGKKYDVDSVYDGFSYIAKAEDLNLQFEALGEFENDTAIIYIQRIHEEQPVKAGTYQMTLHAPSETGTITKQVTFKITGEEMPQETVTVSFEGGIDTYQGQVQTTDYLYGDTVTVKVTPKITPENSIAAGTDVTTSSTNQVALFLGEVQIADAQRVTSGQEMTFSVDTSQKQFSIGENTITVKYQGDSTSQPVIPDYQEETSITVNPKPLQVLSATAVGRMYDETNVIPIQEVTLAGILGTDDVSIDTTGITGTISSTDVGNYDKVTLSNLKLTGADAQNYTLTQPQEEVALTANIEITKKEGETTPPEVTGNYTVSTTYEDRYCYTVTPIAGAEYQMDGEEEGNWQDSNVFDNLAYGSSHTFYARIKETDNVKAGAVGNTGVVNFDKQPGQATVTLQGWQYGSTPNVPSALSETNGTDQVTYWYKEKVAGADTYTETVPQKAGTYTVKAIFPETEDYNGVTVTADFVITKALLSVTKATGNGKKYDGRNTVAITEVLLEGIVKTDDVKIDTTSLTGTLSSANAGSYDRVTLPKLTLTGADAGNYTFTQPQEAVTFTAPIEITKKDGESTPPEVTGNYTVSTTYENRYCYTVTPIAGAEYQMDGQEEGNWQDGNVFDNLEPGSSHTFYARIKETDNVKAGAVGNTGVVIFEEEDPQEPEGGNTQEPEGGNSGENPDTGEGDQKPEGGNTQEPEGGNSGENPDTGEGDEKPEGGNTQEPEGGNSGENPDTGEGDQKPEGEDNGGSDGQNPENPENQGKPEVPENPGNQGKPGGVQNHFGNQGTLQNPPNQNNSHLPEENLPKEDVVKDHGKEVLEKGKTFQVNGVVYKVVTSDRSKGKFEVSCLKTTSKKIKKVKLSSYVAYQDVKYQIVGIEKNAFSGCNKLTSITIGKNITTIGNKAFYKCTSLKKITLPAKVAKIGKSAFAGCKKLKSITIKTSKLKKASVGKKAFQGIHEKATIKVPKKQLKLYKGILKGVGKKVRIKA